MLTMTQPSDNTTPPINATTAAPVVYGMLAEFADVDGLLHAAAQVRDAGYRRWDCFTPFPVHGLDRAMGLRPTRLPWLVLGGGLFGGLGAILVTLYTMAGPSLDLPYALQSYPMLISGKPYDSFPAFVPVIFEMAVLFAAFAAVFGMLGANRLPRLHHPLFASERFCRATADRFFIAIEADDDRYDASATRRLLESAGAAHVEEIED